MIARSVVFIHDLVTDLVAALFKETFKTTDNAMHAKS